MKSTCFQGDNSTTENICCNHCTLKSDTSQKVLPTSPNSFQGAWATSPRKRRNRTECPLPPTSDFLQRKKKSMKILMKVCSWHGFEKQLKKSNQFPASSQPKSISYNQYLSILGYTLGKRLPIAPPLPRFWVQTLRIDSRLFVGWPWFGQGPWLAKL